MVEKVGVRSVRQLTTLLTIRKSRVESDRRDCELVCFVLPRQRDQFFGVAVALGKVYFEPGTGNACIV